MSRWLLFLPWLTACGDTPKDTAAPVDTAGCLGTDLDGDNYTDCDGDCDDGEALINPSATTQTTGTKNSSVISRLR